ncbi:MAG TPA: hypothetical protein VFP98_11105 [Candidatus Polarisedimenticolia bacterium]|nr:hypothetical protein [Candidatus Polarisedimenticolia bacterium]
MSMKRLVAGSTLLLLLAACGGAPQQSDTAQNTATEPPPAQAAADTGQAAPPPAVPEPAPVYTQPAPRPAAAQPASPKPAAAQPAAPAPARPAVHMVEVPSGTTLMLAMDTGLNSKTALVGDVFTATLLEPIVVDGREVIPAGSKVEGEVTEAVPAKRGAGNAKLAMSFDHLTLTSGFKTDIVGTFQEVTESKKKRNAAIIGGSAAGGALLGRILGKDTKGAVIGAIVAGGIGTAVVMGQEGEQAKLPADTPFEIRLEEAVQVPHEPSGS